MTDRGRHRARPWQPPATLGALGTRCRRGLLVLLLAWGVGACGTPPQNERLWTEERAWARTTTGAWVHGLVLSAEGSSETGVPGAGATRTLAPSSSGLRFRAVAMPLAPSPPRMPGAETSHAERPALHLSLDDQTTASHVIEPTPIDLDLGQAKTLTVSTNGNIVLLRPRLVAPGVQGRTMVLVVADTLRADHANPENMPQLSRRFADGLRFEHALSPAAWTLPAVASLFTGTQPPQLRAPDGSLIALAESTPTLAQGLAERGWTTVAVIANETVNHENGFSQGFELFHAPTPKDAADRTRFDARWLVSTAERYRRWFADEDLFLYLQPMDPHDPYLDHATGERLPAPRSGDSVTPEQLARLRAAYASEVRYLDEHLGSWLAAQPDLNTVVVTADHGEELYDQGGFRHGPTLVDPVVRVPLWIDGEGIPAAVDDVPVSLRALHGFFLGRAGTPEERSIALDALRAPEAAATSETFTFGPPRFSVALDTGRPIVTARPLEPKPVDHPVARWLRATQPAVSWAEAEGSTLEPSQARTLLRRLAEQYRGYRRGVFLAFDPGAQLEIEALGVAQDGWFWGRGAVTAERQPSEEGSRLILSVEAEAPFLLLFLPEDEEAASPGVRLVDAGRAVDLDRGLDRSGVRVWHDAGRPAEVLAGQAVTLERLEALGYL